MAEELTAERVKEMLDSGDAQIVDVREEYEHEAGHVAGDRYVPLPKLSEAAAELDKSKPVVVYCRTGSRSAMAADALQASGWEAYNLKGGFVAWLEADFPAEPEGAEAALHSPLP
jgi:rhodanese-related sulfurtransferase